MDRSEWELVTLAKAGDREAFNELVKLYRDKMFALIYRMTGDRESTLDLTQETFFAAFKEIRRFRAEARFSSWLYRIASNKTINFLRRAKLLTFLPLGGAVGQEPTYEMTDSAGNDELRREVSAGIKALPPKQRAVFNLRFYDGLAFGEIADILGRSESTVKTNYQKAVEKLQKRLKDFR